MTNKNTSLVVLAMVLVLGLISSRAVGAVIWNETGDAGELPGTAQAITGSGPLTQINGVLDADDHDLYLLRITDPGNYSFVVVSTAGTGANSDTILALFNASGIGMVYNDDIDSAGENYMSQLTSGGNVFITAPGDYYLGIMGGLQTFASEGNNIWEEASPWDVQKAPDGINYAGGALTGYNFTPGTTANVGAYTINILGGVTAVPEPAHYGIAFAVMGLMVAGIDYRNSCKRKRNQPAN